MVEIIRGLRIPPYPTGRLTATYGPLIHIHSVQRHVHGNGISITVYGEMQIAAGEFVMARELKLNTLQVLSLTCEQPSQTGVGYIANKRIFTKGAYDNYASIDIYDDASNLLTPGIGPEGGSIWLNFIANGE